MRNQTALAGGILLALLICAALAVWLGRASTESSRAGAGPSDRGRSEARLTAPEGQRGISAPEPAAERSAQAAPVEVVAEEEAPDPDALVLTLLVQDAESAPLEGALVTVTGQERVELASVETGPDGTVAVTLAKPGDVWVHAVADGYEHASFGLPLTAARRHVLGLRRLARLTGRVLDAVSEAPIRGAVVECLITRCEVCSPCDATTDADGRFTLDCVPLEGSRPVERRLSGALVGTWIHASAEGYAGEQRSLILEEPDAVLEFRLLPGAPVSFRLRDQGTGLPLAGARIESTRGDLVETDAAGEARSTGMLASGGRDGVGLTCRSDGHADLSFRIDPLTHDPDRPIELELPAVALLTVTVTDPEGQPVVASVSLYPAPDLDRSAARPPRPTWAPAGACALLAARRSRRIVPGSRRCQTPSTA